MIPTLPRATAIRLLLIRTALLAGMLVFGAVTWFMQRQDGARPVMLAERATTFGYVFIALAVMALIGMFVLRRRLEKGVDEPAAVQTYILGYALAEGAALFGGIVWFFGGSPNWYVAGLLLMTVSFQVLPIKR